MSDTEKRKHALFNASSADFWLECNLWVHHKMAAEAAGEEYDKSGPAAVRGTMCHDAAEVLMNAFLDNPEAGVLDLGDTGLTAEELKNVSTAVESAMDLITSNGDGWQVWVEVPLILSHEPESDGYVDVLAYRPGMILVDDHKFGEMAVSPNAAQLRVYGANAIDFLERQGEIIDNSDTVLLAVTQPKLHVEALVRRYTAGELRRFQHYVEVVVENQRSRDDRRGAASLSTCEWCPFKQRCEHHSSLKRSMFNKMKKEVKNDGEIEEIVRARGALKKIIDEAVELVVSEEERFPNWTRARVANARKWSPLVGDEGIGKQLLDAGAVEVYGLRSPAQIRDKNKKLAKLVETLSLDQGHHVRLYEGAPKSVPVVEPPKRPAIAPVKQKRTNKQ
jgi:hypothetical protein